VFTLDGKTLCPAILRVLGILDDAGNNFVMTIGRLVEDFERHGMTAAHLRDAIGDLVPDDRRLVFSGVADYHDGLDSLFAARERPLRLSWAGHGYFHSLIRMPVYLQWAFGRIRSLREEAADKVHKCFPSLDRQSLTYRLAWTLYCFEIVVEQEMRLLEQLWKSNADTMEGQKYMRRQEVARQNLACDVFFSALVPFTGALSRHIMNVQRRSATTRSDAERIASAWVRQAEKWIAAHAELFGGEKEEWALALHLARKRFGIPAEPRA
jgi:hypothetical protein